MGSTSENIERLASDLLALTKGREDLTGDEVEIHFFVDECRRATIPHFLDYGELVGITMEMAARLGIAQSDVQMTCNLKGTEILRHLDELA